MDMKGVTGFSIIGTLIVAGIVVAFLAGGIYKKSSTAFEGSLEAGDDLIALSQAEYEIKASKFCPGFGRASQQIIVTLDKGDVDTPYVGNSEDDKKTVYGRVSCNNPLAFGYIEGQKIWGSLNDPSNSIGKVEFKDGVIKFDDVKIYGKHYFTVDNIGSNLVEVDFELREGWPRKGATNFWYGERDGKRTGAFELKIEGSVSSLYVKFRADEEESWKIEVQSGTDDDKENIITDKSSNENDQFYDDNKWSVVYEPSLVGNDGRITIYDRDNYQNGEIVVEKVVSGIGDVKSFRFMGWESGQDEAQHVYLKNVNIYSKSDLTQSLSCIVYQLERSQTDRGNDGFIKDRKFTWRIIKNPYTSPGTVLEDREDVGPSKSNKDSTKISILSLRDNALLEFGESMLIESGYEGTPTGQEHDMKDYTLRANVGYCCAEGLKWDENSQTCNEQGTQVDQE